jgi:hypothetical protein
LLLSGFGGDDHVSPTQVLYEAAVENEDDDYWDVQSDEEMLDVEEGTDENTMLASREFNIIRRIHHEHSDELGIRRHDAFIYDGLLTHYKPEYAASPLRNLKTARVFAHYIHVVSNAPALPFVPQRASYNNCATLCSVLPTSWNTSCLTLIDYDISRQHRAYQFTSETREIRP